MRFSKSFSNKFTRAFSNGFAGAFGSLFQNWYQWITFRPSDIIQEQDGTWAYKDNGLGGNNLKVGNTQVATFDGIGSSVLLPLINKTFNQLIIRARVKYIHGNGGNYNGIFTSAEKSPPFDGPSLYLDRATGLISAYSDAFRSSSVAVPNGEWSDAAIRITSGINGTLEASIDGERTWDLFYIGDINNETVPFNAVPTIGGYSATSGLTNVFEGLISFIEVEIDGNKEFSYHFQEGQGSTIFDASRYGNHGTVNGAILEDFWANKSDLAYPILQEKGVSEYLVCESAGTTAYFRPIDLTAQDNVWEFDLITKSGNVSAIYLAQDTNPRYDFKGYAFIAVCNTESARYITLRRIDGDGVTTNVLWSTEFLYIESNTKYRYKIIESNGNWYGYIKGGSFGDSYVLIDAAGNNPAFDDIYQNIKFFNVDNDPEDEISHITYNGNRFNPNNFINQSGSYGVQKVIGV